MSTKDYYRILNVKSNASAGEIKHAYRRLAMNYHPDRNPDDALAAAVFSEVAEAYRVLSKTETRRQYNYQRYYTAIQEYEKPADSVEALLYKIQRLKKQIAHADPFRFNSDALLFSIKQLMPDDIDALLKTDLNLVKQFLEAVVICCHRLTSVQVTEIKQLLEPLYTHHAWLEAQLENLIVQQQKKERWEKYKIVLVLFIALALCVIIFLSSK